MDYMDYLRARDFNDARIGLTDAFMSEETPEQMALRTQKARQFNVPVGVVDAITPEEVAKQQAEAVDLAALMVEAPQFSKRLADSNFAKLVKDDITNVGWLEKAVWKLAPDGGTPDGIWQTARNSGARGAYSLWSNLPGIGSIDRLTQYRKMLNDIRDKEKALSEGKSNAEVFGSAEDPTGSWSRRQFDLNKDNQKKTLGELIMYESEATTWANRMMAYFPQSAMMEKVANAKTLPEALAVVFSNPLEFFANVGFESMTQLGATIPFLIASGGLAGGAAVTFASSAGFDRSASIASALSDLGVDPQDPEAVADMFMNPAKRAVMDQIIKEAEEHALMTGIADAASYGVAGKMLLPKRFAKNMTTSGQNFANTLVQLPVQGAFGAGGEALGQLYSKGEIESWGDVVAEFAGEFFTAPLEVMTAGVKATSWAEKRRQKALKQKEALQEVGQAVLATKLSQRDPETASELINDIGEATGITTVYVNPTSLQQAGVADRVRMLSPTVDAQFDKALEEGSVIAIPIAEYAMKIAPTDTDGTIAMMVQSSEVVSYQQAEEDAQAVQEAISNEAVEAVKENPMSAQRELTQVGQMIAQDLKAIPEVTPDEATAIRATVQVAVGSLAKDMGISPLQVWEKYGARILGEPKVRRDEKGNLIVDENAVADNTKGKSTKKKGPFGEFFPALKLIARWKSADRSTLLHETGHMFLEMRINAMRDLLQVKQQILGMQAQLSKSQQRVIDVGNAILKWAGVDSVEAWDALSQEQKKKIHEKWARSYEAYVAEGKAPTRGVEKAFRAFTQMLKTVYTVLLSIPGAELNDEVRMLFDNIFLTHSQIREAMIQSGGVSFLSVEQLGLSPIEGEQYNQAIEDMYAQAEAEQMTRNAKLATRAKNLRQEAINALKKEARGRLKQVREEVEAEAKGTNVYKAWHLFKNGEGDFKPKLYRGDLKELGYTDYQIKKLHEAGLLTKTQKKDLKSLRLLDYAIYCGYGNEKEMLDDLLANIDLPKQLDEKAATRFAAENPMFANDRAIEDAAATAWFNDAKLHALGIEIRALERMVNAQQKTETKAMESVARAYISTLPLTELSRQVFVQAAKVAARNFRKAFLKGDIRSAIFFKRQEIYQTALAKAAKDASRGVMKLHDYSRKFTGKSYPKAIHPMVSELMQRIFAHVEFSTLDRMGLNPSEMTIAELFKELEEKEGVSVDVDPSFLAQLSAEGKKAIETVGGMAQLYDLLKQLDHVGRYIQHINIGMEKHAAEDAAFFTTDAIEANAKERGIKPLNNREEPGLKSKVRGIFRAIGAAHARIPSLLAAIEGNRTGHFFDYVVAPMDRCGSVAESLKREYAERLNTIFKPIMKSLLSSKKKTYKSVGMALTKMQVFAIALNTGNEGNMDRLTNTVIVPGKDPITQEQALALITEALTEEELKIVQQVWDTFESMRKRTGAVHKRITGREPLWVKATPRTVISSDGKTVELKGGYYPIVYDREATSEGARINKIQDAEDMTSLKANSGVFDGHTKQRSKKVSKDKVLSLTLRATFEGLDRQIHYVAWAEWVNQTQRFMKLVEPTIRKYWGSEASDAVSKWIDDIRTGGRKPGNLSDKMADLLRSNVSLAGIGFNVVTALIQPIGIIQSVPIIGSRWLVRGLRDFVSSPLETRDWVASKSAMMANRMNTQFREIAEIQAQLNGTTHPIQEKIVRSAYMPLTVAQMAVDLPTWVGAYNKALSEGMTDDQAISYADRAVTDSQGSGRMQDLSDFERSGSWAKLFTVFYTFFNTAYNLAMMSKNTKDPLRAAVDMLMILVLQPVIESFLRSIGGAFVNDEEMDDDWWLDAIKNMGRDVAGFNMSLFVCMRELQYVVDEYNNYSGPGGLRKITDTGRAITKWASAIEKGEVDESTIRATVSAFGVWVGLPVTPINRAIKGGHALWTGETDNYSALFLGYDPN